MPASPLGKVKMVAEVVAILALILGREHLQQFYLVGTIALWVAVVTAVVSGVDYYRRYLRTAVASERRRGGVTVSCGTCDVLAPAAAPPRRFLS